MLEGFGFCEYEEAESVLRALRLLPELLIAEKQLIVRVDDSTQKYLDSYDLEKANVFSAAENGEELKEADRAQQEEDDYAARVELQRFLALLKQRQEQKEQRDDHETSNTDAKPSEKSNNSEMCEIVPGFDVV